MSWLRRTVAVAAGVLVAAAMIIIAAADPFSFGGLLISGPPSKVGEIPISRRDLGLIAGTSFLGVAASAGFTVTLLLWDRRPRTIVKSLIYSALLFSVLTLSMVNYVSGDYFVPAWQQAVLDLILVFLGAMCVIFLWKFKPLSESAVILKAVALFLLTLETILLPAYYGTMWLLVLQGALSMDQSRAINPGWFSAIGSIGSLALAARKARDDWGSASQQGERARIVLS